MVFVWKRFILAAAATLALGTLQESEAATVSIGAGSISATDNPGVQTLDRNGIPSQAPVAKPFPGADTFSGGFFYSLTFDLLNVQPGTTVSLTTTQSTLNLVLSMYDTSFDPNDLASHYLGDAGVSSIDPLTFSVTAPGSGHVLIVASTVNLSNTKGFSFAADVTYTPNAAVPEPASLAMLSPGVVLVAAMERRRRRRRRAS